MDQLDLDFVPPPEFTLTRMMTYWLCRQLVRGDWWTLLGNDNGRGEAGSEPRDEDF